MSALDDLIKEVQAKFPEYKVTEDNLNGFYSMLEEERKGYPDGLKTVYRNGNFVTIKIKDDHARIDNPYSMIINPNLPDTIMTANIKDFNLDTEARKKVYNYFNDYLNGKVEKGLYIYGGFSVGKTYALGCFYRMVIEKNKTAIMLYVPDLVTELKNSMNTPRYGMIIDVLKDCDVLLLDELGAENLSQWFRDEVLGPVINYRMIEKKGVFITSNIHPKELEKYFRLNNSEDEVLKANRIFSRLISLVSSISFDDSNKYKR